MSIRKTVVIILVSYACAELLMLAMLAYFGKLAGDPCRAAQASTGGTMVIAILCISTLLPLITTDRKS